MLSTPVNCLSALRKSFKNVQITTKFRKRLNSAFVRIRKEFYAIQRITLYSQADAVLSSAVWAPGSISKFDPFEVIEDVVYVLRGNDNDKSQSNISFVIQRSDAVPKKFKGDR